MARIRIGAHQNEILERLKEHQTWNPSNPTFDYNGPYMTNRLLNSLVGRKLATVDESGTYRLASDGPPYIVGKASTPRKARNKTQVPSEPKTTIKKVNANQLAAALPTDLLKNELLRRGYIVERVSVLDDLIEWSR